MGAVSYIEGKGYVKGAVPEPFGYLDHCRWHRPSHTRDGEVYEYHSMWIREMDVFA